MEENKRSELEIKFAKILKENEARKQLNQEITNEIGTVIKEFSKFGKEIAAAAKDKLLEYLRGIQLKVDELNVASEICLFLHGERRKYSAKVIEAKIRKDGYDTKYYQNAIDEIIEPLLKDWESALEFEKRIPHSKQIEQSTNVLHEKSVENKNPIEAIDTNQKPLSEKTIQEINKVIPKLPPNFKQIQCDGSEKEIMDFFMLLTTSKNRLNDKFYMSENDVKEFVEKNFSVFKKEPSGNYFAINILPNQKIIMRYFICQFTVKYNRKLGVPKIKYAMLLINNFKLFKDDNPETLVSNMSESKKPKSALDIIQIPKQKLA